MTNDATALVDLPREADDVPAWNGFSYTGWNAPLLDVPVGPKFHPNGVHKGHTAWDQQYVDVGVIRLPTNPVEGSTKMWVEDKYGIETSRWLAGTAGGPEYSQVKLAVVSLAQKYEKLGEPVTGTLRLRGRQYRLFFWVRDLGPKSPETGWAWRLVETH